MKKITLLIWLISIQLFYLNAQTIQFSVNYGGIDYDGIESIRETPEGGYIVAGNTRSNDGDVSGNHGASDFWIVKLDNAGSIEWQNCYGGTGNDNALCIRLTSDGGFIVSGRTVSNNGDVSGNHGGEEGWVIKLDVSGNIEWQKCLGGSANDNTESIQQTSDGGYIVGGYTDSNDGDISGNHGGRDITVFKLDSLGDIEWQRCYGGSANDYIDAIIQTLSGGYVFAGHTGSTDGDVTGLHGQHGDYWVVKLDVSGNIVWQKCLGGTQQDEAYSIYQTMDTGFIVVGRAASNDGDVTGNNGGQDAWVVKLDSFGNIEWQKCYGGTNEDHPRSIQQTSDGGYVFFGFTNSNDGDVTGNHGGRDYWIVKIDDNGILEWQKCIGGTDQDTGHEVQQTSDGGYIVAGESGSDDGDVPGNNGAWDDFVVKLCTPDLLTISISNPDYCYTTELIATSGFESYLWSTGDTTEIISIDSGGVYNLTAYNETDCPSTSEINAPDPADPYSLLQICIVTLDEEIEKNKIIYEPELNVGIDSILFYRLNNQTSEYELIGSNSLNSVGLFVDQYAIPAQQSYQYKLAIKDTCGKTSELSFKHQTILLQANVGINNEINLFWNAYAGFDYPNFGIYRSVGIGEYFLVANVPNNIYTFTDIAPPFGDKKYQIRVEKDPPCNIQRSIYSYVHSNQVFLQAVSISENELCKVKVYPNPFDDKLIIECNEDLEIINIELLDIYGRLHGIYNIKRGETKVVIATGYLSPGVFYLRFNNIISKRIIKQ